ncbi:MAG: thioredoxin family protein [Phycisphaerales bacterium]|nr:MAG: thioredoxin family protein [Phycisphaerales bacterium]
MKTSAFSIVTFLCLLSLAAVIQGAEKHDAAGSPSSSAPRRTVNDLYPDLTRGALSYAVAATLPEETLLRAGTLVVDDKEVMEEIAKAPSQMQQKLKKNAIFLLERIATFELLLAEARADAAKSSRDILDKEEPEIIQDYLRGLTNKAKVSDAEIRDFYSSNTEMLRGVSLVQVRPQIEQFLLQQKQQELIDQHVRTVGRRMQIEISASWLDVHAALATDNPVDKARANGRASLIDFGSTGCVPCDMMAPVLATLREKYKGRLDVLFVHVGEEPILASRYGVESIPVQILFDRTGKEIFRHVGFLSQERIEKRLAEIGVK